MRTRFAGALSGAPAMFLVLCAALLPVASRALAQGLVQGESLPPGFQASLETALRAGDVAARNAAVSAGIADDPARREIVERTRRRIQESGIAEAVVSAIARYPANVFAIVRTAVARAPGFRDVIVYRATLAFPGFAAQIAGAAGNPGGHTAAPLSFPAFPAFPAVPAAPALPAAPDVAPDIAPLTVPVFVAPVAPAEPPAAPAVVPVPPQPDAGQMVRLPGLVPIYPTLPPVSFSKPKVRYATAPPRTTFSPRTAGVLPMLKENTVSAQSQTGWAPQSLPPAPAPVDTGQTFFGLTVTAPADIEPAQGAGGEGSPSMPGPFGLSEFRIGIAHHDSGVFGRNKEDGPDIALQARFQPFTGGLWDKIWRPRPHVGLNVNTRGDTSSVYAGLTWQWDFWSRAFVSFDFGAALHDGKLSTDKPGRKELGSRILFREALELGYRIDSHNTLSLRLDHMSNAKLADNNEGLDTVGLIYGYRF